jgi:TRAP-type C4-dicarboxylate transport system permease small subunit
MSKIFNRIENLLTYSAMISTLAMMLLTTADAAGRYLFNFPILWAYEFTEDYLLVATVFLGTSCAYRGGGFIRVTFFTERLSSRVNAVLVILAQISCISISILFIWATAYQIPKAPFAVTLDVLPSGPGYLLVLVGLTIATLAMFLDLVTGKSALSREESKDH